MSKQSLLLVDDDSKSLRVLEVSLKRAGFSVTTANNGRLALAELSDEAHDLVICSAELPELSGYDLCRQFRERPGCAETPFIFLTTSDSTIDDKIKGLELGVDEYLSKPIYIKELLTRIQFLLQKKARESFEKKKEDNTTLSGRLADMGVADLIQSIEVSRNTGLIHLESDLGQQATLFFKEGAIIDAEAGHLQGEDAVYRLLTWNDGTFEALFRAVRRQPLIKKSAQELLFEGIQRLDELVRLQATLPDFSQTCEVVYEELWNQLSDLPDEASPLLRLFNSRRTIAEVIDDGNLGDLEAAALISQLVSAGIVALRDPERERDSDLVSEKATNESVSSEVPAERLSDLLSQALGEVQSLEAAATAHETREAGARAPALAKIDLKRREVSRAEQLSANLLKRSSEAQSLTSAPEAVSESAPGPGDSQSFQDTVVADVEALESLVASRSTSISSKNSKEPTELEGKLDQESPGISVVEVEATSSELLEVVSVSSEVEYADIVESLDDSVSESEVVEMVVAASEDDSFAQGSAPVTGAISSDLAFGAVLSGSVIVPRSDDSLDPPDLSDSPGLSDSAQQGVATTPSPPPSISSHDEDDDEEEEEARSFSPLLPVAIVGIVAGAFLVWRSLSQTGYPEEESGRVLETVVPKNASARVVILADGGPATPRFGTDAREALARPVITRADVALPSLTFIDAGNPQEVTPASSAQSATTRLRTLLMAARRARRKGNMLQALRLIDDALDIRKSTTAMLQKAETLIALGDSAAALAIARELTTIARKRAHAWRIRGLAAYELKDFPEARDAFTRYLELKPGASDAADVKQLLESF